MMAVPLVLLLLVGGAWPGQGRGGALEFTAGGDFFMDSPATGTGTVEDPVVVAGSMNGENATLDIFNLNRYGNFALTTHEDAIWIQLEIFNDTAMNWDNFDFELQTELGQASTNPDGLSFAQGHQTESRPWTSENYGVFEEFDQDRDFINFTGGIVMPGQTAVMRYIISHNGRANPVHLLMRPNFSPISPPIPEPSTLALGVLGALGWFCAGRRKRNR